MSQRVVDEVVWFELGWVVVGQATRDITFIGLALELQYHGNVVGDLDRSENNKE